MRKRYEWVQKRGKTPIVVECVIGGKDEIKQFRNYARMVYEMTKNGWKPYGWDYKTNLNF